jgi:hypothetical protein
MRRQLLVPGGVSADKLRLTLQEPMGWTNSHLHGFVLGEPTYGAQFHYNLSTSRRPLRSASCSATSRLA